AAMERFWQDKIYSLASGDNQLLVARQQGVIVATVMVGFSAMPNGRHRAEISKLLVHPAARRQGIARRLMQQAEQLAGSIPLYAESTEGALDATTVMYKVVG
ncbi:GNAT family N-acetyltransferase, partial [Type-E symbiont of Plautia stali]|uniref:GNAT family N-acetyltransferase n=1 Tax=Type-E symbiont of Plautia stali TaxID=1560357 RepID=UPI000B308FE2